ncbi:alpha/beta fold hydrolase, partial [candidate division WOR-3 bacterium]|nr:alpha/beta fold hydrolase [candidate division WOR-3 bacterium]
MRPSKLNLLTHILMPAIVLVALPVTGCRAGQAKDVAGMWQGTLKVPGAELRVVFHLSKAEDGRLSATLDSPDQGATGIQVDDCSFSNGKLKLTVKSIAGGFEGTLKGDSAIEGTWTQGGASLPLVLKRIEKVEEARRPQEPKPPYPYKEEEVTVDNKAAGITLTGTLTEPDSGGPFPAVVLITGSGPENRNEEVFGHRPFLVLSDYLTRQGIAVLRCDDRGVGKSTGDYKTATTADLATDAKAEFEYLKTRKDIDPKRIGLLGHSEGGIIAPIVANQAPDVAFVVLMAGTGLPGDSVLMLQSYLVAKAEGASDSVLARGAQNERALLDLVLTEPDTAVAAAKLRPLLKEMMAQMTPADSQQVDASEQAAGQQIKQVLSPWFRYFLSYDPRPALMKLKQPV